jgi:hypothetical protein
MNKVQEDNGFTKHALNLGGSKRLGLRTPSDLALLHFKPIENYALMYLVTASFLELISLTCI